MTGDQRLDVLHMTWFVGSLICRSLEGNERSERDEQRKDPNQGEGDPTGGATFRPFGASGAMLSSATKCSVRLQLTAIFQG